MGLRADNDVGILRGYAQPMVLALLYYENEQVLPDTGGAAVWRLPFKPHPRVHHGRRRGRSKHRRTVSESLRVYWQVAWDS